MKAYFKMYGHYKGLEYLQGIRVISGEHFSTTTYTNVLGSRTVYEIMRFGQRVEVQKVFSKSEDLHYDVIQELKVEKDRTERALATVAKNSFMSEKDLKKARNIAEGALFMLRIKHWILLTFFGTFSQNHDIKKAHWATGKDVKDVWK